MSPDVLSMIFVTVLAGLLIAAVTGVVIMYRQVGQLHIAIINLTDTLGTLRDAVSDDRRETHEDIARIHLRIDDLVKRPT